MSSRTLQDGAPTTYKYPGKNGWGPARGGSFAAAGGHAPTHGW